MEEYLTINELSQRIKMKPGSIRNLMSSGKLILNVHYVKPTPKKILFMWSAIEAWLYQPEPGKAPKKSPKPQNMPHNGCLLVI